MAAFSREEEQRLTAAIRAAEAGNRGEVRVHLDPRAFGRDPQARARTVWRQLGMHTEGESGVLFYVALRERAAVVLADRGAHTSAPASFWDALAREVADGFARGAPVAGLTTALERLGDHLRAHLPGDPAGNELSDELEVGA